MVDYAIFHDPIYDLDTFALSAIDTYSSSYSFIPSLALLSRKPISERVRAPIDKTLWFPPIDFAKQIAKPQPGILEIVNYELSAVSKANPMDSTGKFTFSTYCYWAQEAIGMDKAHLLKLWTLMGNDKPVLPAASPARANHYFAELRIVKIDEAFTVNLVGIDMARSLAVRYFNFDSPHQFRVRLANAVLYLVNGGGIMGHGGKLSIENLIICGDITGNRSLATLLRKRAVASHIILRP